MAERHGPVRTCIGCRQRGARDELLRVVLRRRDGGAAAVVRDHARRLPGRGAWLHDDQRCVEQATKRRAFQRALRSNTGTTIELDGEPGIHDGAGHVTSPD